MLIGMEYVFFRKGPMTMGASQLCGFAKSDSSRDTPNLQFHIQPISTDKLGGANLHNFHAFTPTVANIRPTSRGEGPFAAHWPTGSVAFHRLAPPPQRPPAARAPLTGCARPTAPPPHSCAAGPAVARRGHAVLLRGQPDRTIDDALLPNVIGFMQSPGLHEEFQFLFLRQLKHHTDLIDRLKALHAYRVLATDMVHLHLELYR